MVETPRLVGLMSVCDDLPVAGARLVAEAKAVGVPLESAFAWFRESVA